MKVLIMYIDVGRVVEGGVCIGVWRCMVECCGVCGCSL